LSPEFPYFRLPCRHAARVLLCRSVLNLDTVFNNFAPVPCNQTCICTVTANLKALAR
jgi:hypothetical protein